MERLLKIIAQHGARVKEIDDRLKELEHESKAIDAERAALNLEREREVFAIRTVEEGLEEADREKSWTAQHRYRRHGDPLSVVVLLTKVLENHPEGMNLPAMLAGMRKLGFQTDARSPAGILRSTLDRREETFFRLKTGRWCLRKYAPPPLQNVVPFR